MPALILGGYPRPLRADPVSARPMRGTGDRGATDPAGVRGVVVTISPFLCQTETRSRPRVALAAAVGVPRRRGRLGGWGGG